MRGGGVGERLPVTNKPGLSKGAVRRARAHLQLAHQAGFEGRVSGRDVGFYLRLQDKHDRDHGGDGGESGRR